MFSGLLFLVFALFIISMAPERPATYLISSSKTALTLGVITYFLLLVIIWAQVKFAGISIKRVKSRLLTLTQSELIALLYFYHYVLGSHRQIFILMPDWIAPAAYSTLSLIFYFFGLYLFHLLSYTPKKLDLEKKHLSKSTYAFHKIRLWLPFVLPYLFLTLIAGLLKLVPTPIFDSLYAFDENNPFDIAKALIVFGIIIGLVMMLFPWLIQKIWLCKSLDDMDLWLKLEKLCKKAKFKHAGFRTWTVMDEQLTAAIIGVIPRFRYIMFTKRLLYQLPKESVEAILAHEIGHSQKKHLLLLPYILFGMFLIAGLFSMLISDPIFKVIDLYRYIYGGVFWDLFLPFIMLVPFLLIFALYFRIVFGHFSRLFERQADLYGYHLNISLDQMHSCLDQIATLAGGIHKRPSWHHYSIQDRMDFLDRAKQFPHLIKRHDKKVKRSLILYTLFFIVALFFLIAPLYPQTKPFSHANLLFEKFREKSFEPFIDQASEEGATQFIKNHPGLIKTKQLNQALLEGYKLYSKYPIHGIAEYSAATSLTDQDPIKNRLILMTVALKKFTDQMPPVEVQSHALKFSDELLKKAKKEQDINSLKSQLIEFQKKLGEKR